MEKKIICIEYSSENVYTIPFYKLGAGFRTASAGNTRIHVS